VEPGAALSEPARYELKRTLYVRVVILFVGRVKGGRYRRNNRHFPVIYATITSMIAGLPLRLASRPRFSAGKGVKRDI
jgi:hypothetical protein